MTFYHKDCVVWGTVTLSPMDRASLKTALYGKLHSFKLKPLVIGIFDNVAIVTYYLSYRTEGQDFLKKATYTWMKKDDEWQIIGALSCDCQYPASCGWRP